MNKAEQKTLVELLEELPDERKGNGIKHKLAEVIMIGILCIMCNGMTFTAMELFGKTHEKELREFMELPHGIPSHDTFWNIFSRLDPEAVSGIFDTFLGDMKEEIKKLKGEEKTEHVISVDGKTIRHSGNKKHKAYHIVTAFCSDLKLVLGQTTTEEKSNEITAIPKLLNMLQIKGCTSFWTCNAPIGPLKTLSIGCWMLPSRRIPQTFVLKMQLSFSTYSESTLCSSSKLTLLSKEVCILNFYVVLGISIMLFLSSIMLDLAC